MPEMKHNFQKGRMNKDLDERIVPDGEYREALNIEVATSEGSDIGSLQTTMGNTLVDQIDPSGSKNLTCIGSIADNRSNKLYWFVCGDNGYNAIAEYDYTTGSIIPVCVTSEPTNKVLSFDKNFLITGINIMDGILYWTDNNSEPKKINITRSIAGTPNFNTHTKFKVRDVAVNAIPGSWVDYNLGVPTNLAEEHVTIIKKGPPAAPVLEMVDTTRGDIDNDGNVGGQEIQGDLVSTADFLDSASVDPVEFWSSVQIQTPNGMDWQVGDWVIIYSEEDPSDYIRAQISNAINPGTWDIEFLTGNKDLHLQENLKIKLEDVDPLFKFKFPRFGYRYKYEDGEYSCFSPFTEVAFLPGKFNYMCKEGYNLGMVNNLRKLAIKDFVYSKVIPQDVIGIDILYKESNSSNVYSVKHVKRRKFDLDKWDSWNAYSSSSTTNDNSTKGYLPLTSEMIHAVLPSNQLLRPWDNVPRKALAQEIIGNRLVYGNYLQNYNLDNEFVNPAEHNIKPDLSISYRSRDIGDRYPEEFPERWGYPQTYSPAKSVKTLRTYQVGIVYIDKYGRETPVLSEDTRGGNLVSQASVYVPKDVADKKNSFIVHARNTPPSWATHYKYFIKETSNEYYNMAMDRWYDAEDGNIWLSFPSAERNKVDEETFLILKKQHDNNTFVSERARYKIIAIENEAPRFIKLQHISMGSLVDYTVTIGVPPSTIDVPALGAGSMATFPYEGGIHIYVQKEAFINAGWDTSLRDKDVSQVYMRVKTSVGISKYYRLKQVAWDPGTNCFILTSAKVFDTDMSITSPNGTWNNRITNCELQVVKRIPEDKAEFEGRFFAKILRDETIINALGTSGTSIELFLTQASMQVQYINPRVGFAHPAPTWYGQPNKWRISVDSRNSTKNWHCEQGSSGQGTEYWKRASRHDEQGAYSDSNSKGWFIDAVEGFVPFNNTMRMFGDDSSKRMNAAANPWNYLLCWWAVGRGSYEDDPTKKMLKVLGVNTYGQNYSSSNYLGLGNVKPPVQTNNNNTVENTSAGDNGGKTPNRGIDGNFIFLSYSGLIDEGGETGTGPTSWSDLDFDFQSDAIRHQADILFIEKLRQPGCIFTWREDPGKVYYRVKSLAGSPYEDQMIDSMDGKPGVAMYNYANFVDYWTSHVHHKDCVSSSGWPGWLCEGTCGADKDTLVSRGKKNGWIPSGWTKPMSGTGCWSYDYSTCWIPHNCITGGGASSVTSHCPETHVDHVRVSQGNYTNYNLQSHNVWPVGVWDWGRSYNMRRRYVIKAVPLDPGSMAEVLDSGGNNVAIGEVGPHYYKPTNSPWNAAHFDGSLSPITVNPVTTVAYDGATNTGDRAPGIRPDGMHTGYGIPAFPWWYNAAGQTEENIPQYRAFDNNPTAADRLQKPPPGSVTFDIKEYFVQDAEDNSFTSNNPAIWETEPKEDVGLDIYYEVGQIYPIELNDSTIEQHVGPVGPDILKNSSVKCKNFIGGASVPLSANGGNDVRVLDAVGSRVLLGTSDGTPLGVNVLGATSGDLIPNVSSIIEFERADGSITAGVVTAIPTSANGFWVSLHSQAHFLPVEIPWFNCYSDGNGVESDRIRDDYNQVTIDNGPKASTTLEEPYLEERRCSGFIWSGIYNSNSGVNDLNQFIQAEAITKDVNPGYGCIQKTQARDNDLVAFCEDRVLKVFANKDALYNADGNTNVVATNRVLGAVKPFLGDYGISKNPESFASDSYRSYFSDASRGAVLRLSQDGITPISDAGMKDWFADVLPVYAKAAGGSIIGSFDNKKQEYNITLIPGDYNGSTTGSGICDDGSGSVSQVDCQETINVSSIPSGNNEIGYVNHTAGGQLYNQTLGIVPYGEIGDSTTNMQGPYGVIQPFGQYIGGVVALSGSSYQNVDEIHFPFMNLWTDNIQPYFVAMQEILDCCPNGNVYLHFQESTGNETTSREGEWVDSSAPILTYQIDSITLVNSRYELEVTYYSGIYPGNISNPYFWYSADGCGSGSADDSSSNGTIIQNIEDETSFTLVYSEGSKGWVSFRSYLQESGVSLNNEYYTFKNGELYFHHSNEERNNYYGNQYDSYVNALLNRIPGMVKSFTTLNYEGSIARITADETNPEYYDNTSKEGWYVSEMASNLQEIGNLEFISKEEKYFSQIKGVKTIWTGDGTAGNVDPKEFSFQGIGNNTNGNSCPDCGPTVSWNCTGYPCECVQVSGSQGSYPTQAACQNDTSSCCGTNATWCCTDNGCVDPGDGSGDYSSLCDCVMNSNCCDDGYTYLYDCLGLQSVSAPYIYGCMDDGITTDPFITQNRPSGWVGPSSNYNPSANVPNCDCLYETLPTYDCIEGDCEENTTGNGFYTGPNAENDCINECSDPCDGQNMGIQMTTTNPTELDPPCVLSASDGSVSVMVTNNNSTSLNPFTSWTVEYYDSIWSTTGPPTMGSLIYSDPNTYATGVWSNTYVGLTTANGGTESYNIYYAVITDNYGCQYGPFNIRIDCLPGDPCDDYPGDLVYDAAGQTCCGKCDQWVGGNPLHPCYDFCNEWQDCCDDDGGAYPSYDCVNGNCVGNAWGTGQYTGPTAWDDCDDNCGGPCYPNCDLSLAIPYGFGIGTYVVGAIVEYNGDFYMMGTSGVNGTPGDPLTGWELCCSTTGTYVGSGAYECDYPLGTNLNAYAPMISGIGFGDEFCCDWEAVVFQQVNPSCPGAYDGVLEVFLPIPNNSAFSILQGLAFQQGNIQPQPFITWTNANGDLIGNGASTVNLSSSDTLTGMPAGTYTAEVWNCDSNDTSWLWGDPYYGCSQPGCSYTVTVTLVDPSPMSVVGTVTDATPSGTSTPNLDGSVSLNVSGGVAPYTYAWSNGASTQTASGLGLGPISVAVTDAGGCTATGSWFVLIN